HDLPECRQHLARIDEVDRDQRSVWRAPRGRQSLWARTDGRERLAPAQPGDGAWGPAGPTARGADQFWPVFQYRERARQYRRVAVEPLGGGAVQHARDRRRLERRRVGRAHRGDGGGAPALPADPGRAAPEYAVVPRRAANFRVGRGDPHDRQYGRQGVSPAHLRLPEGRGRKFWAAAGGL